jgi:hypothetical protein
MLLNEMRELSGLKPIDEELDHEQAIPGVLVVNAAAIGIHFVLNTLMQIILGRSGLIGRTPKSAPIWNFLLAGLGPGAVFAAIAKSVKIRQMTELARSVVNKTVSPEKAISMQRIKGKNIEIFIILMHTFAAAEGLNAKIASDASNEMFGEKPEKISYAINFILTNKKIPEAYKEKLRKIDSKK